MAYFVFANARPGVPFYFESGAERTSHELVTSIAQRGISVLQLCVFPREDIEWAGRNAHLLGVPFRKTNSCKIKHLNLLISAGCPLLVVEQGLLTIIAVHRSHFGTVLRLLLQLRKPDLLVTWLTGSDVAVQMGDELHIPTLLRVVGPDIQEGYPPLGRDTTILANSPSTAQICTKHYGRKVGFLAEPVDHSAYICHTRSPKFVTYVNPRESKGVHLFCRIAPLLQRIPFLVVRSWSRSNLGSDESDALNFLSTLPNVSISPPLANMSEIYSQTRILLLPSKWQESWARVVGEAQVNGIPVIASSRGSSAQQIGNGGIILKYGEPRLWAALINQAFTDDELFCKLRDNALENVKRFRFDKMIDAYLNFFLNVANGVNAFAEHSCQPVMILRGIRQSCGKADVVSDTSDIYSTTDITDPELS